MTDTTANLGLPVIAAAQAQKHVTHNEALRLLDTLVQLAVADRDLNDPPGAPSEGERWIVGPSPTDAWAGHADDIAAWQDGTWQFSTPRIGWVAFVVDEGTLLVWNGTAWGDFFATVTAIQNLALLGIGAAADLTNPFSAKLNKALWTAKTAAEGGDGDLRYTMNKETAADVLSFLLQTGFSGRAEIGLIGDDNLAVKVSADGSTWNAGLIIDKVTGGVSILELSVNRIAFPVTQSPSSDPNSLDDYEEGTWMPSFATSGTQPTGATSSTATGYYTKIGNMVTVWCTLMLTSKGVGGTGSARIDGLPFTVATPTTNVFAGSCRLGNVTLSAGYTEAAVVPLSGSTEMGFTQHGSGLAASNIPYIGIADASVMVVTATYFV